MAAPEAPFEPVRVEGSGLEARMKLDLSQLDEENAHLRGHFKTDQQRIEAALANFQKAAKSEFSGFFTIDRPEAYKVALNKFATRMNGILTEEAQAYRDYERLIKSSDIPSVKDLASLNLDDTLRAIRGSVNGGIDGILELALAEAEGVQTPKQKQMTVAMKPEEFEQNPEKYST